VGWAWPPIVGLGLGLVYSSVRSRARRVVSAFPSPTPRRAPRTALCGRTVVYPCQRDHCLADDCGAHYARAASARRGWSLGVAYRSS